MNDPIQVVVGVLRRDDSRILLCQRPGHKAYPLQWEFPGGKVEQSEGYEEALVRELREELGIESRIGRLLHHDVASYDDGRVFEVRYYLIEQWQGVPENRDFAEIRWIAATDIRTLRMLQGNTTICDLILHPGIDAMEVRSRDPGKPLPRRDVDGSEIDGRGAV